LSSATDANPNPVPGPVYYFDADPDVDPDLAEQDADLDYYLMWMLIRIQVTKMMRIRIHNMRKSFKDKQPCQRKRLTLIFSSALLEKNLALTMTGCLGRTPLPNT
jgi:hypothetical protein